MKPPSDKVSAVSWNCFQIQQIECMKPKSPKPASVRKLCGNWLRPKTRNDTVSPPSMAIFPSESGLATSLWFLFHLFQKRTFADKGCRFLRARCPSWHPTNSAKAMKEMNDTVSCCRILSWHHVVVNAAETSHEGQTSRFSSSVYAVPGRPARAVRPTRWTYVVNTRGTSYDTTQSMSVTSIPRAIASVLISLPWHKHKQSHAGWSAAPTDKHCFSRLNPWWLFFGYVDCKGVPIWS